MTGEPTRSRALPATALSGAAHLVLDLLATRTEFTTPPYLLLDHASETFRDLLMLDRTTILVVVSIVSAAVNGIIAALMGTAMTSVRSRMLALAAVLSILWVFSGGLMMLVYLSPPPAVVVGSLLAGIPRAFVIAWLLDRVLPRGVAPRLPA